VTSPLVSVCMPCYNHGPYVEEAIRSVLDQETTFAFEVVVQDDASTDDSAQTICRLAAEDTRVVPILQEVNQYSQGIKAWDAMMPAARGQYIAVCECDDSWTDRTKLERQVAAMRARPGATISFHPATATDVSGVTPNEVVGRYLKRDGMVSLHDVAVRTHGQIPTVSIMLTRDAMDRVQAFCVPRPQLRVRDAYMQFIGAMTGGAIYLDRPMAMYRRNVPGSYTMRTARVASQRFEHLRERIASLDELDEWSGRSHHETIVATKRRLARKALRLSGVPRKRRLRQQRVWASWMKASDQLTATLHIMLRAPGRLR